ncbi:MAG: tetratricopeptide repeat protein [bacterium]|nr:tetratricopeptide repeat protein [bacterium]
MKKTFVSLCLLAPHLVLAQPPTGDLEARLESASGTERVELLAELGETHLQDGDSSAALSYFRQSLKLARELGEQRPIADNLLAIGRIHLSAGRVPAAAETLRRARAAATEINATATLRDVNESLAVAYAATGRHREAYEALRQYQELEAATEGEGAGQQLAELEQQLETERRQHQLEIGRLHQELELPQAEAAAAASRLQPWPWIAAAAAAAAVGTSLLLIWSLANRRRLAKHTSKVVAEREQELEQTSKSLKETFNDLAQVSTQLEEASLDRGRLSAELERTSSERERALAKLELTHGELSETAADLHQATSDLEQTSTELDRRARELEQARGEHDRVAAELEQTSMQLKRKASDFEQASTQLAQATLDLGRLNSELEQRKESYRRDISELGDRNAATRERLAEMERFASTLSQHLKILLVSVRSSLGALREDAAAGDVEQLGRDVERTHGAVGRMVHLLDELLKLLLVGRMSNSPQQISMSELAFETVGQVTDLGDRRVEIVIAPNMPSVIGDRAQLQQVLKSLLQNAVKFMSERWALVLEVGARQVDGETVFFVRDNGIGLDPRDHERVFALFERLDPQKDGHGVGLALVQRIISAHGGRVWAESDGVGHGSTFCFTVPPP